MAGPKKQAKQKKGTPPPIDKLFMPAVGIAIALVAYQFIRGLGSEIPRVNVEDELELRDVFFGEGNTGMSYIVLCNAEDSNIPISSVFKDASKEKTPAEFRVLDCNHKLQSGKSVAERFNLDLKQRPTIFLSGRIGEPSQVPVKHLKTGAMLVKFLKSKLEKHTAKIETTQDLRTKCLDKDMCGLLLKGAQKAPKYLKDAMQNLLKEFPDVIFAAVDASVLYVKNLEEYLPELQNGQPRFVVFKKLSGSLDKKAERLITSIAALPTNGVSYGQMSNLVAGVVRNTTPTEKIPVLPSIKTRTKKLEQEERAKRERKLNREKAESTSNGENDGSREGRRAERERRREEHRKQHNVKPKTPEEIAEMERQRRIRMDEQAENWYVAPEDSAEYDIYQEEDLENILDDENDDGDEDVIELD